jgi:hypothetical protein
VTNKSIILNQVRRFSKSCVMLLFIGCTAGMNMIASANDSEDDNSCDKILPTITSGYGADGPYAMESESLRNPEFRRKSVRVFMPKGGEGKRPVIFFSHGYGPNRWENYTNLFEHLVSRGYIVIYSTYPALFANNAERYKALWAGFKAATEKFNDRMDLSRVGFLGHSFGGGATPAMAYLGFVKNGWGKVGGFMMEMAPWYIFDMSPKRWRQIPDNIVQVVQVYDKDDVNDHRMAIAIFKHSLMKRKYYFLLRSQKVDGCSIIADHTTPSRTEFLRLQRYGLFKPLDALADCTFNHAETACTALAAMGKQQNSSGYHPLIAIKQPNPAEPESFYKFSWNNDENPQRSTNW